MTFTPAPEWWKHLRPYNKRRFWKAERRAAEADATEQSGERFFYGEGELPLIPAGYKIIDGGFEDE